MLRSAFVRVSELQSPFFFFFPLISLVSLQPSLVTVEVRLGFIVPLSTSVRIQETSRSVTTY